MGPPEHGSEVVRRRVARIADHVAGNEPPARPQRPLLPMNCSSTLNPVIRSNRLLFARQSSASQACFMRQVSVSQSLKAADASLQQSSANNSSCSGYVSSSDGCYGEPSFARPAQAISHVPNLKFHQPIAQECTASATEPPRFSRQGSGQCEKKLLLRSSAGQTSSSGGTEWSPRMDVAETGQCHVVTLELPGANVIDIKVEVDDKNLTVAGKCSAPRLRTANSSDNGSLTYHQREIFEGPYTVIWPLPNDVNKDSVSAELLNGFLQITLPKICRRKVDANK